MDDVNNNQQNSDEIKKEEVEQSSEEVKSQEVKKGSKSKKSDKAEELEKRIKELEDQLARAVADYRNLEKRIEDDKRDFVKYANRELLLRLIPAFDTLFLAEKYVTDEGIKLTIKHLQESLKDVGVERVNTDDKMFNAEEMEAVTTEEGEENKVLAELRPGYKLNGKLVRAAQVKVGKTSS